MDARHDPIGDDRDFHGQKFVQGKVAVSGTGPALFKRQSSEVAKPAKIKAHCALMVGDAHGARCQSSGGNDAPSRALTQAAVIGSVDFDAGAGVSGLSAPLPRVLV